MTIEIFNEDNWNFLRRQKDKTYDIVFYDPPYNVKKKYDTYDDNLGKEEYEAWMSNIARECDRVSKNGVIVYVAGKLAKIFFDILPKSHMVVVHKKAAGVCSNNYMMQYHLIFSTVKPLIKCKDVWDNVRLPGEGYFFREPRYDNPGLTGLELTKKILYHFTKEEDTILDPFFGTGTTGVAGRLMNRNVCGIEISQKYVEIAKERLDKTIIS